jgi:hypothetical protein
MSFLNIVISSILNNYISQNKLYSSIINRLLYNNIYMKV